MPHVLNDKLPEVGNEENVDVYTRFANNIIITFGPILILAIAWYLAPLTNDLPPTLASQITMVPYVFVTVAMALGFVYRRHRYIVLGAFIGFVYWVVQHFDIESGLLNVEQIQAVFGIASLLFPINYLYLTKLHDRGLVSMKGVVAITIILGQVVASWWIAQNLTLTTNRFFDYEIDLLFGIVNRSNIPSVSFIGWIVIGGILLSRFIKSLNVFDSGFLSCFATLAFAVNAHESLSAMSIFVDAAVLMLVGALIKHTYNLAYIDELTELPGRRALNEELVRLSGTYSIAMLDVDHFKKFNDTHGHDLGDQVLRMVASKLMRIGGGGKPFRYGGEEFCIIFHSKTMKDAFPHLSKLRETIDETRMILRSKDRPNRKPSSVTHAKMAPWREVHVTISIGVAESGEEFVSSDDIIKAADKALYKAKEKGRNRIHQFSKDMAPVSSPA